MLLAIPFAFPWTFGKMAGDVKQGIAVLSAMFVLWLAVSLVAMVFETNGNPKLDRAGVSQTVTATQAGGNMEGKETRFGPAASGPVRRVDDRHVDRLGRLACTTASRRSAARRRSSTSCSARSIPGGTGAGLYGMLLFALLVGVHRRA